MTELDTSRIDKMYRVEFRFRHGTVGYSGELRNCGVPHGTSHSASPMP